MAQVLCIALQESVLPAQVSNTEQSCGVTIITTCKYKLSLKYLREYNIQYTGLLNYLLDYISLSALIH